MLTAFRLRSHGESCLRLRHFGPFVGQLLLRSADRAERVYHAMQCRGCTLKARPGKFKPWRRRDWLFFLLGAGSAACFRAFDFVSLSGRLITMLGGAFR